MSIVRAARKSNFYMLPATVIEDRRLSWAARGLLVYLLSKKDNWRVQMTDLLNQTRQAIGGRSGRDKVYKLINELRAAGYIYQEFIREGGGFRGVEYEVSEVPDLEQAAIYVASVQAKAAARGKKEDEAPFADLPETVAPVPKSPAPAEPFTEKPETLDSTESAYQIEKALTYDDPKHDRDFAEEPSAGDGAIQSQGDSLKDLAPANYPQNSSAVSYAPWHAYADAYHAKHQAWPVCNKRMLSQMCQLVDRVGDLAPMVATYFVLHERSPQIVKAMHPVGALLKNCESYATRAQKSQRARDTRAENDSTVHVDPAATRHPVNDKGAGIGLSQLLSAAAARSVVAADGAADGDGSAEVEPKPVPAGLIALRAARPGPQPVRFD